MKDWSGMLTVTGVVATLISVFFAVAAWYVQQKRRSLGAQPPPDTIYVESPPPQSLQQTQMVEENQPVEAQVPLPEPPIELPEPVAAAKPAPPEPSVSLFKRYSPSGNEEAVVSPFRDDEYIWE